MGSLSCADIPDTEEKETCAQGGGGGGGKAPSDEASEGEGASRATHTMAITNKPSASQGLIAQAQAEVIFKFSNGVQPCSVSCYVGRSNLANWA